MVRRSSLWSFVLAGLLGAAGCGDSTTSSPLVPTTDTAETFTGTLLAGGTSTHTFEVTGAGTVYVSLSAFTPSDARVALGIGNWVGTTTDTTVTNDDGTTTTTSATTYSCSLVLQSSNVKQSQVYTADVKAAGTYCITMYDGGYLQSDLAFTVEVRHP